MKVLIIALIVAVAFLAVEARRGKGHSKGKGKGYGRWSGSSSHEHGRPMYPPMPHGPPMPNGEVGLHFHCECNEGNGTAPVPPMGNGTDVEMGYDEMMSSEEKPDLEEMFAHLGLDCKCEALHIDGVISIPFTLPGPHGGPHGPGPHGPGPHGPMGPPPPGPMPQPGQYW